MSNPPGQVDPRMNQLLAALPEDDYRRLAADLEVVELKLKDVNHEPGQPIAYAHFPLDAVISLLTVLPDGTAIEFATVGREGMAGLPLFLGVDSTPSLAFCQVAGSSARLTAAAFREHAATIGSFDRVLRRHTQSLLNTVAQTAACNRVHSIEERCARWLLMTHDRVVRDEFPLTHEFLSQMLGVRRAGVTVAAGVLMKAGLIRYVRGRIAITDRAGLEEASCGCYSAIREVSERLLAAT